MMTILKSSKISKRILDVDETKYYLHELDKIIGGELLLEGFDPMVKKVGIMEDLRPCYQPTVRRKSSGVYVHNSQ